MEKRDALADTITSTARKGAADITTTTERKDAAADMAITKAAAIITTKRVRPTKPSPNEEHIRQPVYLDNLWGPQA